MRARALQSAPLPVSSHRRQQCTHRAVRVRRLRLSAAAAVGGGGADERRAAPTQAEAPRRRTIALAAASAAPLGARGAWRDQYAAQQQVPTAASTGSLLLPFLVYPFCELPTETLTPPVQEPAYQEMFELVERSSSRLFGAALAQPATNCVESVGALCELTHLVRVPDHGLLLAAARVVGRFQAAAVLAAEPFVAVRADEYADVPPADEWETLSLAAQERRVWRRLLHIARLEERLELGAVLEVQLAERVEALTCSPEIMRWSPSSEARGAVPAAPAADTAALHHLAGLLGGDPATLAQRTSEHLCQDALRAVSEAERRERFSFALAAALETPTEWQQQQLYTQSTAERLHAVERELLALSGRLAALLPSGYE